MDATWLEHALTADEAREFEERGYVLVPRALDAARLEALTRAVDAQTRRVRETMGVAAQDRFHLADILALDPAFYDLIDRRTVFPKIWGILGWNIQIYHSYIAVAPPYDRRADAYHEHQLASRNPAMCRSHVRADAMGAWQWHRDSGEINVDLGPMPHARISVKAAYFLTDTLGDADANLHVVPGSQNDAARRSMTPGPDGRLAGAVCVKAAAGDAVIFDRRIVHSPSPNLGTHARKVLFYGYSHRWLRPRDDQSVDALIPEAPPIRRQLLGWATGGYGHSSPEEDEVPLKGWLERMGARRPA